MFTHIDTCFKLFALRERNQARFELSNDAFDATQAVCPRVSQFMTCKERHNICMISASLERVSLDRVPQKANVYILNLVKSRW